MNRTADLVQSLEVRLSEQNEFARLACPIDFQIPFVIKELHLRETEDGVFVFVTTLN